MDTDYLSIEITPHTDNNSSTLIQLNTDLIQVQPRSNWSSSNRNKDNICLKLGVDGYVRGYEMIGKGAGLERSRLRGGPGHDTFKEIIAKSGDKFQ